jgi:uncharacterized repeat protein (TIGR01451 family)
MKAEASVGAGGAGASTCWCGLRAVRRLLVLATSGALALTARAAPPGASQQPITASFSPLQFAERVEALVELTGSPVVPLWVAALPAMAGGHLGQRAQAAGQARTQRAALVRAQQALIPLLTAPEIGAQVRFTYQRVVNGIAVDVARDRLAAIAHLPGVQAVAELPRVQISNFSTVPLIGAPQLWNPVAPGLTGAGVRIGIIDSGIDYIHKDFGGSGDYQGQDFGDTSVPWTDKVSGGYDFVDRDLDPMDECNGHGTHVAGTVAGYGVGADGATYAGPYGPATDFSSLRIGPGVAPGAKLYALRTQDCRGSGSGSAVIAAIEWAVDPDDDGSVDDHLDVVNLSLGSLYGARSDAMSRALDNAALAGVVPVAASGNDGDVHYITATPAVATRAISVASSLDATAVSGQFRVDGPASIAGLYPASEAEFGPDLAKLGELAGALKVPASTRDGCGAFAAGTFAGKVALIDRGGCLFVDKVKNCQKAGAAGVLIANSVNGAPFTMSGSDTSITIPSMFTTLVAGAMLKDALAGGDVTVTLTAAFRDAARNVDVARVDTVSSFSSRGPRRGDSALKPDITAPGDTVFSALALSGDRGSSKSGTSMATPHVAGVVALLRQLHPDWTVEELKALVLNTAHDLFLAANGTPPIHGPGRVGAGRVDVVLVATAPAVAFSADEPGAVSLSFGALEVVGTGEWIKTVRVANKSLSTATYQLGYAPLVAVPGASLNFPDGATVTVGAGTTTTFRVRLQADATQLKHAHDPALTMVQLGRDRHWITEMGGAVTLTPAAGPPLRVPVYALLRPAATMSATPTEIVLTGSTTDAALALTGGGVATGNDFPAAVQSLVSAFELQALEPKQSHPEAGDLWAVGVATDYPARVAGGGGLTDSWVYFGVATQGDWTTPNELDVEVEIDTNRDGSYDFLLAKSDASGARTSDAFIAVLCPRSSSSGPCESVPLNGVSPTVRDTTTFGSNVMVLPVSAARLGLTDGGPRFNYRVSLDTLDQGVDWSDWLTYDPAHPAVTFAGTDYAGQPAHQPLYTDQPGASIPVHIDVASFVANGSRGALLLHHHNRSGERVQVISFAGEADLAVELSAAPDPVAPGDTLTYTATVRNHGPLPAANVQLEDQLPAGVSRLSASASQGSCSGSSLVTCNLGALTAGSAATVSIAVKPSEPGPLVNSVSVASGWADPVLANNTAIASATVGGAGRTWAYRVPSVAHTTGTGNTVWRSDIAAVNGSAEAASLTLVYRAGGAPLTRQASLPAGGTLEWPDILVGEFGLAAAAKSSGSLEIVANLPLALTSRTYNQGTAGTFGQSYPALAAASALPLGVIGVLPQLAKTAAVRSNIGVQNLGGTSCTVGVRLFDAAGAQVGSKRTATAAAGAWYQLNDIFGLAGAGTREVGYALVEAENTGCLAWAYASVVDAATGDPTTIPLLFAVPSGPYFVPSVAHTTGAGGTVWRTDVAAVNRSGAPASLTLTFTSDTQSLSRGATLADGATVVWSDILVSLFGFSGGAKVSGTVKIEANVPLAITSRTYNQGAAGTYGQFYPGLTVNDAIGAGRVGVLPQLKKTAATRTNVGVQNLGATPCTVLVTLHSTAGAQVGSGKSITVPGWKWLQVNDIFAATGAGNQSLAYATVEVQTPGGTVWAYASVIDAATGDPTTISVIER